MIPLEQALDIQNHPEKYAQLEQEKLEKEMLGTKNAIEHEKWLKHPCTVALVQELSRRREELIDQTEKGVYALYPQEAVTIRKVLVNINQGKYPTQL